MVKYLKGQYLDDGKNKKTIQKWIDVKREHPNQWYQFLKTKDSAGDHVLNLTLDKGQFPYIAQKSTITSLSAFPKDLIQDPSRENFELKESEKITWKAKGKINENVHKNLSTRVSYTLTTLKS